jgi:hypothetical protein
MSIPLSCWRRNRAETLGARRALTRALRRARAPTLLRSDRRPESPRPRRRPQARGGAREAPPVRQWDVVRALPDTAVDRHEDAGAPLDLRAGRGRPARRSRSPSRSPRQSRRPCSRTASATCSTRRRVEPRREEPLPVPTDHQRNAPGRAREQHGVLEPDERTREADPVAGEQASHELERLREARNPTVERKPERSELRLVPAGADAEDEPAAGDLVHRRRRSRQHPRSVERGRCAERPQPHPRRHRRQRRELRPPVPGRPLRQAAAR